MVVKLARTSGYNSTTYTHTHTQCDFIVDSFFVVNYVSLLHHLLCESGSDYKKKLWTSAERKCVGLSNINQYSHTIKVNMQSLFHDE